MPRHFTLEQAQRVLPEVEATVREAVALKRKFQEADAAVRATVRRISVTGGAVVDRGRAAADVSSRDSAAGQLASCIKRIQEHGCLVKDLDMGLLDFPARYRGAEVYLCWKLGEPRIEFWHGPEEGFRGRKPIDSDFLQHHTGEAENV